MPRRWMSPSAYYRRILTVYRQAVIPWWLRHRGVTLGRDVRCQGMPIVSLAPDSRIVVGHRVVMCSDAEETALGVERPVILRTLRPGASIVIGDDVGMSGTVICAATSVEIGSECLIGADVQIVDTDFHPLSPIGRRYSGDPDRIKTARVRVGRNVFLGAGVRVLKGVTIGDDAVIGAGSVVVKDIPAACIAAGNPARVIRALDGEGGQ